MQLKPCARECTEALEMNRSLFDSSVQILTAYKAVVSKVTLTVCGEHQCDYRSVVNRMQDNRSLEDSPGNTCQTTVIEWMVERPFAADNETQASEPYVCSNCGVDSGDQDGNIGACGSGVEDEHQTGHGFPTNRKLGLTGIEKLSQVCSKEHQTVDAIDTFPASCKNPGDNIVKRNRVQKDRGDKVDGALDVVSHSSGRTKRKMVKAHVPTEDLNPGGNHGKGHNPKRNKIMRLKASGRNKTSGDQANVKTPVGTSQKKTPTKVIEEGQLEEEKSMVTEMEREKTQAEDIFGNTTQDDEASAKKTSTGLEKYNMNLRRYPHFAVHRQFKVCPICRRNKGNNNWLYLFDHIKEAHLSMAKSRKSSVICAKCDWSTPFNAKCCNKSNVMDITTKYILHCVVEHEDNFPLGFYRYHCQEEEGCYIAYTANDLRDHVRQHGTEPSMVDALYLAKADQKSMFARQEKQKEICGVSLDGKMSHILSFKEFRCMLCDDSILFPDKMTFNNHIIAVHVQRSAIKQPRKRSRSIRGGHIDCPLCTKGFAIRASDSVQSPLMALMRHMIRKHNAKVPSYVETFKCTTDGCTYESVQKDCLMTHIKRFHSGDKYREECHICGKMVPNFTMNDHVQGHKRAGKLASCACDTCGKGFKNEHFLKAHIFGVHQRQKEEYLCSECCFICNQKDTLMHHLWREHNQNPENRLILQCSMCDYKNILKQLVKVHERDIHGQKNVLCGTCGKAYSSSSRLKIHQRIHNEKNLLCPHCDYKARLPEVMRAHVNAYHRNKVYECSCGYTTRFSGNLYTHKKKYCPVHKQKQHPANQIHDHVTQS